MHGLDKLSSIYRPWLTWDWKPRSWSRVIRVEYRLTKLTVITLYYGAAEASGSSTVQHIETAWRQFSSGVGYMAYMISPITLGKLLRGTSPH